MEAMFEKEIAENPKYLGSLEAISGLAEKHKIYDILEIFENVYEVYPGITWKMREIVASYVPAICSTRNVSEMSNLCTLYATSTHWEYMYVYLCNEMKNAMGKNGR